LTTFKKYIQNIEKQQKVKSLWLIYKLIYWGSELEPKSELSYGTSSVKPTGSFWLHINDHVSNAIIQIFSELYVVFS
jgi:hypothetical protein